MPVSGFISPGEVEALRRLKATPGTRFIKMLPCALPPRYDPSAEDSRELAADRLLILSGFAETPPVPARDIRKYLAASHQFRANCLAMNDLAAELCGSIGAQRHLGQGFGGARAPGGSGQHPSAVEPPKALTQTST